jgi:hypothetical protein
MQDSLDERSAYRKFGFVIKQRRTKTKIPQAIFEPRDSSVKADEHCTLQRHLW